MNTAFLSLGGNLGDRRENLNRALSLIEQVCGKILKTSGVYETAAWGTSSTKKYLNQVVKVSTTLGATALLTNIHAIEKQLGRKRSAERYADRTIDIDLLFFNSEIIALRHLRVPHERLHERKFVLLPFAEIEPRFIHPALGKTIQQLLKESKDRLPVKLLKAVARPRYICIEGNIGSGTTTLAQELSKKLDASYLGEAFDQNNLLPLFYKDPKTYAFPLEYSFLISRYEQIYSALKKGNHLLVSDFSFYKSRWFAKVNLTKKEFALFRKHFDALAKQLPKPDAVIYISTTVKQLRKNISTRGRSYEEGIQASYLKSLEKEYTKGIHKTSKKILSLKLQNYTPGSQKSSILRINKYLKENFG
ncbi:MAG: 2-amino-4-hydroxy-6-hydroxymethyldihydropteridine diphosphokinase [bacterium]|nr:2-amino-4-hydroxy-6-hydroxymethyldihydropteridine diphosphokinase [bacterium]